MGVQKGSKVERYSRTESRQLLAIRSLSGEERKTALQSFATASKRTFNASYNKMMSLAKGRKRIFATPRLAQPKSGLPTVIAADGLGTVRYPIKKVEIRDNHVAFYFSTVI